MKPIRSVVLAGTGLDWGRAEMLLELWRLADHKGDFVPDADGFVTFAELRESLMNSQPHVWRRITAVRGGGVDLVEVAGSVKGQGHHANSHRVRISKAGIAEIKPVWERLRKLAAELFDGIGAPDRRIHFLVNQRILQNMNQYRHDAYSKAPPTDPVENVLTALKIRRELMPPREKEVLGSSGLMLQTADILVDLYGALKLKWPDPKADQEGFVTFKQLQASSVHGESSSQVMLSRRLRELEALCRIQIKKARPDLKYLTDNDGYRITDKGVQLIEPVWRRYQELAETLLTGVSKGDRSVHCRTNEALLVKLQPAWARLA